MPTYLCFILDGKSHVSERLSIECENDDETLTPASAMLERRLDMIAIEVWEGKRRVGKIHQLREPDRYDQ
jgi:hypothetical protein